MTPLLLGVIAINLVATAFYSVLPTFATSKIMYSLLLSVAGVGILLGSSVASLSYFQIMALGKIYIPCIIITGLCWLTLSFLPMGLWYGKALALTFFLADSLSVGVMNIYSQTIVQLLVPKERIASAMGSMMGLSLVFSPLGALLGGYLGKTISLPHTLQFLGFSILLVALYWTSQPTIRRMDSLVSFMQAKAS